MERLFPTPAAEVVDLADAGQSKKQRNRRATSEEWI